MLLGLIAVSIGIRTLVPNADAAWRPEPSLPQEESLPPVDFARDVLPILSDTCFACHGPDAAAREGDLRLDQKSQMMQQLDDELWIVAPGKPHLSELIARIETDDLEEVMPPSDSKTRLTAKQKQVLRRWVQEGAVWEEHWAFRAPKKAAIPLGADASPSRHPIDGFVSARHRAAGLSPSPVAAKDSLLRRAFLDLGGLPPSPKERAAFLADSSQQAYAKALDRQLSSPRFGQHLAAYWMDLARYADTNGHYFDNERTMWPWRDWVVNAFNSNLPYSEFIVAQIAGDLLPNATDEQRIASGFNRNHPVSWENGIIPEEYRVKYVFDRTDTTAAAFLGLTMGCAQCHDHKFDPISHLEYFSFFAFFNQVTDLGADGIYGNAQPTLPAPSTAQRDRLRVVLNERQGLDKALNVPRPIVEAAEEAWIKNWAPRILKAWKPLGVISAKSESGATLSIVDDGEMTASGALPANDVYDVHTTTALETVARFRLDALNDPALPKGGPGRAVDGNFILNDLELTVSRDGGKTFQAIALERAVADTARLGFHASAAIDDDPKTGWAVGLNNKGATRSLMLELDQLLTRQPQDPAFIIRWRLHHDVGYPDHSLGRFALWACSEAELGPDDVRLSLGPWRSRDLAPDQADMPAEDLAASGGFVEQPTWRDGRLLKISAESSRVLLRRSLDVSADASFRLEISAASGLRVWLDGELKHHHLQERSIIPAQDRVPLVLTAGHHKLLVELRTDAKNPADFYFDLRRAATESLEFEAEVIVTRPEFHKNEPALMALRRYYRRRFHPELRELIDEYDRVDQLAHRLVDEVPTPMVMEDRKNPRKSHLLLRGRYDQPGEEVTPNTPAALPPLNARGPGLADRLDLARWMIDPSHPLTARVVVNRVWEQLFGKGFVPTAQDFGIRGERPSHPKLLDWLAVEFVESAWDLKALYKLIMTSDTYRRNSVAVANSRQSDPENRWLTRGPRTRLSAETLRDQALYVAGRLNEAQGGRSFFPYQPPGIWEEVSGTGGASAQFYRQSHGDDLYRRSLYVFWKRSAPWPPFLIFDAPTRDICTVSRQVTNTPQQALVLMNETSFVEAARLFAERLLNDPAVEDEARLKRAFLYALSREAETEELRTLQVLLAAERRSFRENPQAAKLLLEVGETPASTEFDAIELAAWALVANTIMNLDEMVTKE